jgi:hypothetical protein
VMYHNYEYRSDFKLDKDDIEGIQVGLHWTKIKIQSFNLCLIQIIFIFLMILLK